jgi:hypothetical protein
MKSKNTSSKIFASMNKSNKSVSNTSQIRISVDKNAANRTRIEDHEDTSMVRIQPNQSRSKERSKSKTKIRNVKESRTMSFDLGNSMILSKSYYAQTYGNKEYKKPDSIEKKLISEIYVNTKEDAKRETIKVDDRVKPGGHRNSSIVYMENPMNSIIDSNPSSAGGKINNSSTTFSKYLGGVALKNEGSRLKSKDNTINSSSFILAQGASGSKPTITSKIIQNNKSKIMHKLTAAVGSNSNFPSNSSLLKGTGNLTEKYSGASLHISSKERLGIETTKEDGSSQMSDVDSKLNVRVI